MIAFGWICWYQQAPLWSPTTVNANFFSSTSYSHRRNIFLMFKKKKKCFSVSLISYGEAIPRQLLRIPSSLTNLHFFPCIVYSGWIWSLVRCPGFPDVEQPSQSYFHVYENPGSLSIHLSMLCTSIIGAKDASDRCPGASPLHSRHHRSNNFWW